MNLSSLTLLLYFCYVNIVLCKRTDREKRKHLRKDSNTIAIFSEDDIAGKLPSPEQVAAEIPKNMILQKSKQVKLSGEDKPSVGKKDDKKKRKRERKTIDDDSEHDLKSKSMNDGTDSENEDEYGEKFFLVNPSPIDASKEYSLPQIQIPTAQTINQITTTSVVPNDLFKIQKQAEATTLKSDDSEFTALPPLRAKKLVQKSRVKRVDSSVDYESKTQKALSTLFAILFILII